MKPSDIRAELREKARLSDTCNDWGVVRGHLEAAIRNVVELDSALLEDGAGERCIAHRLAVYLEDEFPSWHVDCEFNRQGEQHARSTKRVSPDTDLPESRSRQGSADVTPDIIVHMRREYRNLLAIEVKPSDSANLHRDRAKLRKYLTDAHLKYAFAVLVTYRGKPAEFDPVDRITTGTSGEP